MGPLGCYSLFIHEHLLCSSTLIQPLFDQMDLPLMCEGLLPSEDTFY